MGTVEKKTRMDLLYERIGSHGFDSLTPSERSFFALWWFFAETNNGGLHQFFTNDAGQLAHDALRGLQVIGALATESVLRRAISVFPDAHVPEDRDQRTQVIFGLDSPDQRTLEKLTREFYDCNGDVADAMEEHIATHADDYPSFSTAE